MGGHQRDDELVQALELAAGNWARRPSSRSAMRVAWPATSPVRGRSDASPVRRAVLLQYGDDPEIGPGDLWVRRPGHHRSVPNSTE